MTDALTIARYGLDEAVRRRVFLVVLLLTAVFVGLYAVGTNLVHDEVGEAGVDAGTGVETNVLVGATLFGLAMFGTLFLGTVLAVFLTHGAVRGDAEGGLLQPVVVRPVGRAAFLAGRFLGAAVVCTAYVLAVYTVTVIATSVLADWTPDQAVWPALELAGAVVIVAALSLLGSVFLSAVANGIAIFMLFGAGLVAGLLGQIGEGLDSEKLRDVARATSWALPFEALYQDALHRITAETHGLTGFLLNLGPFGGAQVGGRMLPLWAFAYLVIVLVAAAVRFARRDL